MNTQDTHNKPSNMNAQPTNNKTLLDKTIHIEICRECRLHASSTWHDETKYKKNFEEAKAMIETLVPGCKVLEKQDQWINLGAFEVSHGDQLLYSKKKSGLWPNPKAVAQRIKQYFEEYESGKDVSHYGAGPETAFVPAKKKDFSKTGTGFHQSAHTTQRDMSKTTDQISPNKSGKHAPDDHKDDSHPHDDDDSPEKQNKSPEKQKAPKDKEKPQEAGDHDDNASKSEKVEAKPEVKQDKDKSHEPEKKVDTEHHEKKPDDHAPKEHTEDKAKLDVAPEHDNVAVHKKSSDNTGTDHKEGDVKHH
jgi:selT/selW/selH-like putative selenoprotein